MPILVSALCHEVQIKRACDEQFGHGWLCSSVYFEQLELTYRGELYLAWFSIVHSTSPQEISPQGHASKLPRTPPVQRRARTVGVAFWGPTRATARERRAKKWCLVSDRSWGIGMCHGW